MLDDLNELRTFRAILAEGSLSAAARRLGVTLAVVSRRLAVLERRVGMRLIHRTTRALSPTQDGARLLDAIEAALDGLDQAELRLAGARDEPSGLLRVSAPVSFGRRFVAPLLGGLAALHPRLSVQLELSDRVVDLVGEGFDVVVRIGRPADSSAVMRRLADNQRILVAAPAYLDTAGRPDAPEQLRGHAFLRYGGAAAPWRLHGADGRTAELDAPARLHADSGDAVHDWALSGFGIMLKSAIDVADDLARRRLERVLPGWHGGDAPVVALHPSARHLPLKTRVLLDALVARFAPSAAGAGNPALRQA